jgi:hypothetical protein
MTAAALAVKTVPVLRPRQLFDAAKVRCGREQTFTLGASAASSWRLEIPWRQASIASSLALAGWAS